MSETNYKSLNPVKSHAKHGAAKGVITQGHEVADLATLDKHFAIDATGKALGRVASEAAKALMGKTYAAYTPHIALRVRVTVVHAGRMHTTEKKRHETYTHYSGYPGGLKRETRASLALRRGVDEVLRRTVKGMLPRNRLLTQRMKNLTIIE